MKRLRLWLALLTASVCSLHGAYAIDIKEPVLNNVEEHFDTLKVGKDYYLLNVKTGRLLDTKYISSSYYDLVAGSHTDSIATSYSAVPLNFSSLAGSNSYIRNGVSDYYMYNNGNNTRLRNKKTHTWYVNCVDKEKKLYTRASREIDSKM